MKNPAKKFAGLIALFLLSFFSNLFSQATSLHVFQEWANSDGLTDHTYKAASAYDNTGAFYVVGATYSSGGDWDWLITKFDANTGSKLWSVVYDAGANNQNDFLSDIVIDANCNIYVTGAQTTDSTVYGFDIGVAMYDSSGALQWQEYYDNGQSYPFSNDVSTSIICDQVDRIYVTGASQNGANMLDYITIQYKTSGGGLQWVNLYDGNGLDDGAINLHFDKGNINNIVSTGFVKKNAYGGAGYAVEYDYYGSLIGTTATSPAISDTITELHDVAVYPNGDIYMIGYINNLYTGKNAKVVKLDSNLNVQWEFTSSFAGDDEGNFIRPDSTGHIYLGGYITQSGNRNFLLAQLDTAGSLVWGPSTFNGTFNGDDVAKSGVVDNAGNLIITGYSQVDAVNVDYYTIKYDTSGTLLWQINYNGLANKDDHAMAISIDQQQNIYVIGQSEDTSGVTSQYLAVKYVEHELFNVFDTVPGNFSVIPNLGQLLNSDTTINSTVKYYSASPLTFFQNNKIVNVFTKSDTMLVHIDTIARVDMVLTGDTSRRVYPVNKETFFQNFYYPHTTITNGLCGVPSYEKVVYPDIYRKVDLNVSSNLGGVKNLFIVKPGGNASDIEFVYDGIDTIYLDNDTLVFKTGISITKYIKPHCSQIDSSGNYVTIAWRPIYKISGDTVSFDSIGLYNFNLPLVIEMKQPETGYTLISGTNLEWSTYVGGSLDDAGFDVQTDELSNVYMSGLTFSASFPNVTGTAAQSTIGNPTYWEDAFVTQFNSSAQPIWATYYGGYVSEQARGLLLSQDGYLYFTGITNSDDFVTSNSAYPTGYNQTYYGGNMTGLGGNLNDSWDGFIVSLDRNLGSLRWATYFGGYTNDIPHTIVEDNLGNLIISGGVDAGMLVSPYDFIVPGSPTCNTPPTTNHGFPVCSNSSPAYYQSTHASSGVDIYAFDAFIAKFDSQRQLIWSTFFGGSGDDSSFDLYVDPANNSFYIGGYTKTTAIGNNDAISPCDAPTDAGFPTCDLGGSSYFQGIAPGTGSDYDGYFAKFDYQNQLIWSTFFGNSGDDNLIYNLTKNNAGITPSDLYIVGSSKTSSSNDLPDFYCVAPTNGGFPLCNPGGGAFFKDNDNRDMKQEAFIARFDYQGQLTWSTFYGDQYSYGGITDENQEFGIYPTDGTIDITIDNDNNVYILGNSKAPSPGNIPYLPHYPIAGSTPPFYDKPNISSISSGFYTRDAFLAVFDKYNAPLWTTYFGGGGNPNSDYGQGITYDNIANRLYITGATESPSSFPTENPLGGAYFHGTNSGLQDAFISRFSLPYPVVGVEEQSEIKPVNAYPNPTSGTITLSYYSNSEELTLIQVFNNLGQLVAEQKNSGNLGLMNTSMDLSSLAPGIYIIRVQNGSLSNCFKVIKQ